MQPGLPLEGEMPEGPRQSSGARKGEGLISFEAGRQLAHRHCGRGGPCRGNMEKCPDLFGLRSQLTNKQC